MKDKHPSCIYSDFIRFDENTQNSILESVFSKNVIPYFISIVSYFIFFGFLWTKRFINAPTQFSLFLNCHQKISWDQLTAISYKAY